ncbi:glycosyltransferase, partial [Luoshenia tenuis]|uniref:glycosyltransferase n=1 Tax=Luoshenia tenuis TaxID=2763654 RepID=UPI003D934C5E
MVKYTKYCLGPAEAYFKFKGENRRAMANPMISVIVPVYNVETCLEFCLDSILAQTLQDFEV